MYFKFHLFLVLSVAAFCIQLHKEKCQVHTDCTGQQMCVEGSCLPSEPAGGLCSKDNDCLLSKGQACRYGICMIPSEPPKECIKHTDCKGQTICVNHKCKPAVPTGFSCFGTGVCPYCGACKFDICWTELPTVDKKTMKDVENIITSKSKILNVTS
ncbi:hypothetical protein T08_15192 [Trichinella sp. T8]|nr:hypothetical protein T08_15192 [Trichinella sp. T8]